MDEREHKRFLKLIPLEEAQKRIVQTFGPIGTEWVSVDRAVGMISASEAKSRVDIPAVSVCAMDGFAIRSQETARATSSEQARFRVKPHARGGRTPTVGRGEAVAVSTGDPLPSGADSVLRVEEARLTGGTVVVSRGVERGKNVSARGEDVGAGQAIVARGEAISPARMALLMSAGIAKVRAYRTPRVGVLSVGEGLKRFGEGSPGEKTNNYANLVLAYLAELGVDGSLLGITAPDPAGIRALVGRAVRDCDVVITIGGVSVGPRDTVPEALVEGKSRIVFHGLRAVPLRPAGLAAFDGKPVVMLPAHVVSTVLSFFVVALPVLNVMSGLPADSRRAVVRAEATGESANPRAIDALYLARLGRSEGGLSASVLGWGSNLLSNLSRANGFVRLAPHENVAQGQILDVQLLGGQELVRLAG